MTEFKKIKVLLLAPQKATGGIASWTHCLLKVSRQETVEYKVIDTSKLYDSMGHNLGLRGAFFGFRDAVIRLFKILYALCNYHPDLVYITSAPSIGLFVRDVPLMLSLKCFGIRCILHLRGGSVRGFVGTSRIRQWGTKMALRSCRAVFVITREVEKYLRENIGAQRMFYIPNMIEDEYVETRPAKKVYSPVDKKVMNLIHVAWQAPAKGSMDLVEAMRYVKSSVHCKLVGEIAPEYEANLAQMIQSCNLQNKVSLTGIQKGHALDRLYQDADVFVFPTHSEGFPNVILEAMANGLPIIASDVGNIREMIGYDSDCPAGLLLEDVPPINAVELAKKIDALVQDSSLRQSMGISATKRVQKYYLASKVVPNLESLLVGLAVAKPTPQSINHIFEQKYL